MDAIETLIETHGQRLMRLLRRMLGDQTLAEDAWQETWGAVWKALPRLERGRDAWPFVRKCGLRKALDAARGAHGARLLTGSDPEPAARASFRGQSIDLGFLPEKQRRCLELFFWGGLSVREIARELGVPEGTVKTWMFRARAALRERVRREKR